VIDKLLNGLQRVMSGEVRPYIVKVTSCTDCPLANWGGESINPDTGEKYYANYCSINRAKIARFTEPPETCQLRHGPVGVIR
jgi:hypothetical protein